jgi:CDP-glucose 4,6-dehydratase
MANGKSAVENMGLNKKFWSGKKIFITGHTGFKGGWLTTWLKMLGASVTGYSLPAQTNPNFFELANVAEGMTSFYEDILDAEKLRHAIHAQQPDIVFHLAAQSLVQYSYQHPLDTYQVNVIGTANLLEVLRSLDCTRVVIVVTSDKCYENRERSVGYSETDALGGFDPYSSSKSCAELVVSGYRRSYFHPQNYEEHQLALATVRAGNVLGGGDWAEARLVPDLVRSFTKNETAIIRSPEAFRPWQYILDVIQGYLMLAEQMWHQGAQFAEAWNFGPHDDNVKTVSWIADQLANRWGDCAQWKLAEKKIFHETNLLKLNSQKSNSLLGWQPKMSINHVLEHTINWYKAHFHRENMNHFTQEQIKTYEKM